MIEAVEGLLADISVRVAFGRCSADVPPFASIVGCSWDDVLPDDIGGEVEVKGGDLCAKIRISGTDLPYALEARERIMERQEHIELRLMDGSTVIAELAVASNFKYDSGVSDLTLQLYRWTTHRGKSPLVWCGRLEGMVIGRGNLRLIQSIADGSLVKESSVSGFRLFGNYVWHLLPVESAVVVAVEVGPEFDRGRFADDFHALEFAFGAPLKLDALVGYSNIDQVTSVKGMRLGFRRVRPDTGNNGPVFPRMTKEHWMPVLFAKLTQKLRIDTAGDRMRLMMGSYLDASVDHIDGAYLKLQIALEAFCSLIKADFPETKSVLVKDPRAWDRWVDEHAEEIRKHAVEGPDDSASNQAFAQILSNKVKSAKNPPTSDVVKTTLKNLDLELPVELMKEVQKRNSVAHVYLMSKSSIRDIQEDVRRLERIKVVLVAVLLRYIGYDGVIAGWERDGSNWRAHPSWWPQPSDAARVEASRIYICKLHVS